MAFKKVKKWLGSVEEEAQKDLTIVEKEAVKLEEEAKEEIKELVTEFKETHFGKFFYSAIKKVFSPVVKKVWVEEIEGLEHFPKKGGIILASNHESYFDFITAIAASPRKIHYMAAEKFFLSRLWRPLMHATGQIRVDRRSKDKKKAFGYVYSALKQERVVGIFPEGTRNRVNDGNLQKAFTGVARFALAGKVPVLPVGIVGTYEIMAPHDKFPKFNKKAKIRIGEPMHFKEYHDVEHTDEILLEVTEKIMVRISELSGKEYPHLEKIKNAEFKEVK